MNLTSASRYSYVRPSRTAIEGVRPMFRLAAILVLALGLAGCDILANGFAYTRAVEKNLQASTHVKPHVGFNWSNGRFEVVTVTFPGIPETKSLRELADEVRATVYREFKQKPMKIVLGFELKKSDSGTTAQLQETR
jgi:hypothetical protein